MDNVDRLRLSKIVNLARIFIIAPGAVIGGIWLLIVARFEYTSDIVVVGWPARTVGAITLALAVWMFVDSMRELRHGASESVRSHPE